MIQYTGFADLINKINQELGGFCKDFNYKRKDLASLGKAASLSELFGSSSGEIRNWAINYGGGTEVQYHIGIDGDIFYGIGFNFQYVPYKNDNTPEGYMAPYVEAFFTPSVQELVKDMKAKGYEFVIGDEESLRNKQYEAGDYYLFGKQIKLIDNTITDDAYSLMLEDIKTDMYELYEAIFIGKNNITTKEEYLKEYTSSVLELYSSLLYANKNLVLTGAPGTGKTHLAKQIAAKMIFGENISIEDTINDESKKKFDYQCKFVQFHPSYDYTDFVEGIRPVTKEDNNSGFERKDGVFKEFCKRAIVKIEDVKEFCDLVSKRISDNQSFSIKNISEQENNSPITFIEYDDSGVRVVADTEGNQTNGFSKKSYNELCEYYKKYVNNYVGLKEKSLEIFKSNVGVKEGEHTYIHGFLHAMYEYFHKPFIFIIDEINRGDFNKIFGELFYAIDPGYRGEKGKVDTQYQNLVKYDDIFINGFYIPENVYIIGTMNDIDRSVESMDFAMRRRFVWKEVLAENTAVMLNKLSNALPSEDIVEKARKTMLRLNKIIETIEGLNSSYHIGPAYFLKLKYYLDKENMFDLLWQNHIQPLLSEYLRGYEDYDKIMARLLQAYQCSEDIDNNSNN